MSLIIIKLTTEELELLASLASDQLFRREFIEPKLPGHKSNTGEISLGKVLVARMRTLLDPGMVKRTSAARAAG